MIPLLTYHTESHKCLYDEFFKPSFNKHLSKDFTLVSINGDQKCTSAIYYEDGWFNTVFEKIKFVNNFLNNTDKDFFVFSDVDIIFLDNIKDIILNELENCDMVFQRATSVRQDSICSGFYAMKVNDKNKIFFNDLLESYDMNFGDQYNINSLLDSGKYNFKIFGPEFYNLMELWESTDETIWDGGEIPIPNHKVILFHANYTKGVENKKTLLRKFYDLS
jgi:hypothetical protein